MCRKDEATTEMMDDKIHIKYMHLFLMTEAYADLQKRKELCIG